MSPDIHVKVCQVEPGWILVHYEGPKPLRYAQYHWLDKAMRDWLKQFPSCVLQRVTPVETEGEIVGLNVWYSVAAGPKEMISFDVDQEVMTAHAKEYLEAVMAEVANFMLFGTFPAKHVALVNRRGIATLVARTGSRGLMVPRERLESMLGEQAQRDLAHWLEQPLTTLLVVPMPNDFELPESPE